MERELNKELASGQTSPDYPMTVSTGARPRSDSDSTVVTAVTTETVESTPSLNYPQPPINTPYSRSEIGELHRPSIDTIVDRLEHLPTGLSMATPPSSAKGDVKGKAKVHFGHDVSVITPKTLKKPALTAVRNSAERNNSTGDGTASSDLGPTTPTPGGNADEYFAPDKKVFPEFTTWDAFAEEDVASGLQRLAMLAKDLHKVDNTKTVREYYSERLAVILKAAEIDFDVTKCT